MKKVIVFDMDDTLYDEFEFVKSGFREVAKYLSVNYHLQEEELFQWMWQRLLKSGRGRIFDDLLKENNLFSKGLAKKCVSIYRLHKPQITLPTQTKGILNKLKQYPCYLITDGNKTVQYNKVTALGLDKLMKKCYLTYRHGIKNSKPSPYCIQLIQRREKIDPKNIVYVGDNPTKDFVGIKPLGFRTIRIMTGQHKLIEMPEQYEAEIRVNDLLELPVALKKIWPEFEIEG
ncbi:HAD superfamily hydrolase [Lysinibacillus sp. PLM2]|nr:HAD superfamily hydrolase [Lysinibacillus sp. PLM2]